MKNTFQFILFFFFSFSVIAQNTDWQTFYEKSDYKETPHYQATIDYCKQLASNSPWIKYTIFGKSPQGRDLPLLIVDKKENFDSKSVKVSGNAVLLIQACIHPGEPDGKDAGLMLLRDIAISKKYEKLLDHVTILFIPIFNVDGHERFGPYNRINQNGPKEMGWRVTAQNLNLNRDFMKADAPEMQAWLKLFNEWLPDFTVDCHVTDGADYQYVLTYGLEIYGNMDKNLTDWTRDVYLKKIEKEMDKAHMPIFPYISFRQWHDPRSGLETGVAPPMLCSGYLSVQNRPGLLIETHMLKDYKTRVSATYELLKQTAIVLNDDYQNFKKTISVADEFAASREFRKQAFPLAFDQSYTDSTMVDFLGVEYTADTSDLSGGLWFKYSNDKPKTFKIPFFEHPQAKIFASLPEAYIIPPEWTSVIERLDNHGIKYSRLKEAQTIEVTTYKFSNPKWNERSFEGRHQLDVDLEEIKTKREYPAGSVVVDMNQRTARVIAHFLEPKANDSFVHWGFFDAVFEQKEYGETYVLETLARQLLAENPSLKMEFEEKKAKDPRFAKNSMAMLNWFYSKSPYWDQSLNMYPVGKISDRALVDKLQIVN